MSHLARSLCLLGLAALAPAALTPVAGQAQDIRTASQFFDLTVEPQSELRANLIDPIDVRCPNVEIEPQSAAGRQVANAGWPIIGEVSQGEYTYVSFAESITPSIGNTCLISGKVGIFRGEHMVAQVRITEDTGSIGSITALEPDGVRIWGGDYLPRPIADLHHRPGDLFLIRPIAERDSFCGGRISVPSLYELPVGIAWILLREEGWTAAPGESSGDGAPAEEWAMGRQDCSGTGFGFCAFAYDHVSGQSLNITTAGEAEGDDGPSVVGYEVSCE